MKTITLMLTLFAVLNLSGSLFARADEAANAPAESPSQIVRGKKNKDKKSCPHCKEEGKSTDHAKHGHDKHPHDEHEEPPQQRSTQRPPRAQRIHTTETHQLHREDFHKNDQRKGRRDAG